MRGLPLALVALAWNVPVADASPRRVEPMMPVVVEGATIPVIPRRPGATPDIDVGKVLIGAEAPARVDVYALTEDGMDHVPVASFDRRVAWVPIPVR